MEFNKREIKLYILSGKARSGKDTLSNELVNIYNEKGIRAISIAYASYLKMYAKNIIKWDGNEEDKPREFLQQLGVELIKNKIDSRLLINRIIEDIEIYSYFYDVIIISDARFKEEIEEIKNLYKDVTVIHVIGTYNDLSEDEKNHSTETSLDNYNEYDYEIKNDYLEKSIKKLNKIVKENLYE